MGKGTLRKLRIPGLAVTLLIFIVCVISMLQGVANAGAARRAEARRVTEESLHRAVMSCYALEGRYPPTLDYLTEHYGVHWDADAYMVDYRVFASNIMPEVTVLERK